MRNLLFWFGVCCLSFIYSQGEHEYYDYMVVQKDTSIEMTFSASKPNGRWNSDECWKARSSSRVSGYIKYMDSLEVDSIHQIFKEIALPLLGERVFERTFLYHADLYNVDNPYNLDSSIIAEYQKDQPACLNIKWEFDCYFMFEDSLWFPFKLYFDLNHRSIYTSSIITKLKNLPHYRLMDPAQIYLKANSDPFMKNYPTRKYFDLAYSEKLHYFYFTSHSPKKEKLLEVTKHSSLSLHRHLFLDAFTGAILWRAKVKHFHESIGCVVSWNQIFPPNTLME
ncbi:MAG: hypothetical protein R2799_07505 [Crocinitomicaceae bacterium]